MKANYYTLLQRYNNRWEIVFGDYSREVVAQELIDNGGGKYRIIKTGDAQPAIDAEVARLNSKEGN